MSFFSDMLGKEETPKQAGNRSRQAWRAIFDTPNVQTGDPKYNGHVERPIPGGSYTRSAVSNTNAIGRLLQALRSNAPGGWSDNRYEQIQHYVGIAYEAIHRQNEILSECDLKIYVKDLKHQDGKRPITPDDPPQGEFRQAFDIRPWDLMRLLEKPNSKDWFGNMVARWNQQLDLTGSALTWAVPNELGIPMELYVIPTPLAVPQAVCSEDFPEGYYRVQPVYPFGPFSSYPFPASSVGAAVPAQWMMDMRYPHPLLRYDGYSPLTALRLHMDEVEQIDRSRWYSMKRAIRPSAILNMKDVEGSQSLPEAEIERIRAEFEAEQMGPENHGRLFFTAPGSELKEWGSTPDQMLYESGWEQLVGFIMAGFGIGKSVVGMTDSTSYANLFAALKQFHLLTLNPKCSRFSKVLTQFLAPFYGDNLIVEVTCKRIDDHEVTFGKIDRGVKAGCIKKNEVRKMLELPTTDEPWGDEIAGVQDQREMLMEKEGDMMDEGNLKNPRDMQDREARTSMPKPGMLNRGSLGPRKGLNSSTKRLKSFHVNGKAK